MPFFTSVVLWSSFHTISRIVGRNTMPTALKTPEQVPCGAVRITIFRFLIHQEPLSNHYLAFLTITMLGVIVKLSNFESLFVVPCNCCLDASRAPCSSTNCLIKPTMP